MATTLPTASRNAACNAVVDLVDAGAGAGNIYIKDGGATHIATVVLANPAFGASAVGVATALSVPLAGVGIAAAGAGTAAATFDVVDGSDVVIWSGTVTVTGGGGELTLDNITIANLQVIAVTAFTHTQPASG